MDDNPYRSPNSYDPDAKAGRKGASARWITSVRPAFLLCGGAASTLYGVTLLTTVLPSPWSLSNLFVGLVLGTIATFGGVFLVIYASRLK